jgi:hypothetical protein
MNQPVTPDFGDGLTQQGAQARLARYGYNELPDKKDNPLLKFLSCALGLGCDGAGVGGAL